MADQRSTSQSQMQASTASRARSRSPISRPTTPLRTSSRTSFRNSQNSTAGPHSSSSLSPLDALEPQFAELSDSMADLEANFMHLQLMHESLSRFGESFASFLYGLNMNAFVVDFPEQPLAESIKRWQKLQRQKTGAGVGDETTTFLQGSSNNATATNTTAAGDTSYTTSATDTSFASMKATPRRRTIGPNSTGLTSTTTTPKWGSSRLNTGATAGTNAVASGANKRSGIPGVRGAAGRGSTRGGASAVGRASGLPRGRGGSVRGTR